jgi:phosphoglycerate dehydrogenase-like enzyme
MTTKPRILVSVPAGERQLYLASDAQAELQSFAEVFWHEQAEGATGLKPEERRHLADVDGVITTGPLSATDLDAASRLRIIGVLGSSVRRVTPEIAIPRGIAVVNAPIAMGRSVAELALGLILSCLRHIPQMDHHLRTGGWRETRYLRRDLTGRTIGVIGAGAVGRQMIALLAPFRGRIVVYDPYLSTDPAGSPAQELDVELVGLDDLLCQAEVITIHAGMTRETTSLIGRRELELLQESAVLVNTARGRVFDEAALIEKLREGRIMAGLDVFAEEPLALESELRRLPNVVLTPHAGGYTYDMYTRRGFEMVADIRRFFVGQLPISQLTLEQTRRHAGG